MARDLIKFTEKETKQILVYQDGEVKIVTDENIGLVIAGLSPGKVMDFIKLHDGRRTLIISDVPIEDASVIEWGAEFVPLNEVEVETSSWALPLSLPAILARSMEDRDEAWFVLENLAGLYLEKGAWSDQTKPWKDGLVAALVRAHWDEWKKIGAVEGETHWGWIKGRYFIQNGGEPWKTVKGRFEVGMRCADVFIRNIYQREWIKNLTLNRILEVHISKANRCCKAIEEGLFSHYLVGPSLQHALFDVTVGNTGMNHLIAKARREREEVPERRVDEVTGEIEYVIPATGKVVEEDELDEYLPEGMEVIDVPERPRGTFWTYNPQLRMFGYYDESMNWTLGLSVQTDSMEVRRFVDKIIAACGVAADYDG